MTRSPIWKSISTALAAEIAQGRYHPGDRLPTVSDFFQQAGL